MIRIQLPFTLCWRIKASNLLIMSPVRLILRKSLTQLFSLQLKRNKRGRMIQKKVNFHLERVAEKTFSFSIFFRKIYFERNSFWAARSDNLSSFQNRTLFKIRDRLHPFCPSRRRKILADGKMKNSDKSFCINLKKGGVRRYQCDQIGWFIGLWASF